MRQGAVGDLQPMSSLTLSPPPILMLSFYARIVDVNVIDITLRANQLLLLRLHVVDCFHVRLPKAQIFFHDCTSFYCLKILLLLKISNSLLKLSRFTAQSLDSRAEIAPCKTFEELIARLELPA